MKFLKSYQPPKGMNLTHLEALLLFMLNPIQRPSKLYFLVHCGSACPVSLLVMNKQLSIGFLALLRDYLNIGLNSPSRRDTGSERGSLHEFFALSFHSEAR